MKQPLLNASLMASAKKAAQEELQADKSLETRTRSLLANKCSAASAS